MNNIYFIYDVGPKSRLEWITDSLPANHVKWLAMRYDYKNRIHKWRKPLQFLCYLELAVKTLLKSEPGDCIISWNFIVGAFVAAMCRLLRLNRSVLSLNMISHPKKGLVAPIRKNIYNYVFGYEQFFFTVNSEETLTNYLKDYSIHIEKVTVLPDPYLPVYKKSPYNEQSNGSVFCGGEAQRDWQTFFEAAKELSKYHFTGVARKKYMPEDISVPGNVEMYYDISEKRFDELLEKASIVALPLTSSKAPAGLIVILKSILLSKPLIVTKTSSIANYLPDNNAAVLINTGDVEGLVKGITLLKENPEYARQITAEAGKNAEKYSPETYSQMIAHLIFDQMKYDYPQSYD